MGFALESGYIPASVDSLMDVIRQNVNTQFGTSYTTENFVGTNWYKYFYALIQRLQQNEVKTSEIFLKVQEYFAVTNERISRPVATNPGIIEKLEAEEFIASVKPTIEADAGKCFICVDEVDDHARGLFTITNYANLVSGTDDSVTVGATVFTAQTGSVTPGAGTFQAATSNDATAQSLADQINAHATAGALVEAVAYGAKVFIRAKAQGTGGNSIALAYTDNDANVGATKSGTTLAGGVASDTDYDDTRLAIATIIKNSIAGGIVTQGAEVESITLSNGQSFDFKYSLPNRVETFLKLTITLSENNQEIIKSPEEVKEILLANIAEHYRLGKNFEPQKYFSLLDAPWAGQILLEYSFNESDYDSEIYETDFDELLDVSLENTVVVEE